MYGLTCRQILLKSLNEERKPMSKYKYSSKKKKKKMKMKTKTKHQPTPETKPNYFEPCLVG